MYIYRSVEPLVFDHQVHTGAGRETHIQARNEGKMDFHIIVPINYTVRLS